MMEMIEMPIPGYFYLGPHADAKLTDEQYNDLHADRESLRECSGDIGKALRKAVNESMDHGHRM